MSLPLNDGLYKKNNLTKIILLDVVGTEIHAVQLFGLSNILAAHPRWAVNNLIMDKIAIFIDAAYLTKIARQNGVRVDIKKVIESLSHEHNLFRSYYYYCPPYLSNPPTEEEKTRQSGFSKFKHILDQIPRLELRKGKLEKRDDEYHQKRVDILLAVDLVRLSWIRQIQVAAILTGDSDFVPAIEDAKNSGIITKVFYHKSSVHDELLYCCDDTVEITQELLESWKLIN